VETLSARAQAQAQAPTSHLSIAGHGEQYLTELSNHGHSPATIRTYGYLLGYFDDWLRAAVIRLEQVDRDTVEQWIGSMRTAGTISKRSTSNRFKVIRQFFKWLAYRRYLPADPLDGMRAIKVPRRIPQVLRIEDVTRIIEAAQGPRERVIVELLYGIGCRRSELLSIMLPEVDLAGATVRVIGKGDIEKLLPMGAPCVDAIKAWLPHRQEVLHTYRRTTDALIVGRMGALKRERLVSIVKAIAARAGIEQRVYPHLFRHSYATHLLDGGAGLREVQELLGHRSILTTQIYTHVSIGRLKAAYQKAHPRALAIH